MTLHRLPGDTEAKAVAHDLGDGTIGEARLIYQAQQELACRAAYLRHTAAPVGALILGHQLVDAQRWVAARGLTRRFDPAP